MRISFHGAAGEVTGSNHLIELGNQKILLDCGLFQGSEWLHDKNYEDFDFDPHTITALLLSHAHLDHCGRIPKLVKDGFKGKIYSTAPTRDLTEIVLADSASIMEEEAHNKRISKPKPLLFSSKDVVDSMQHFEEVEYNQPFKLGDLEIVFKDAGHILGSAFIEIKGGGTRVAFSGDLGNDPVPLLDAPDELDPVQYLLTESTYGNKVHDTSVSREDYLKQAIQYIVEHKGTLMIPAFALERTQEILFELNRLVEKGIVPKLPIFLDSPMAIEATNVFRKYKKDLNLGNDPSIQYDSDPFSFNGLTLCNTGEQSKSINQVAGPKVIIAGSGMLHGGRMLHHLLRYLSDPGSLLMIVGYQVEGTLGRRILDGEKKVKVYDEWVNVKAKILNCHIFSAHADKNQLLDWISSAYQSLKKIYLVHGEKEVTQEFKSLLGQKTKAEITVPDLEYFDEV